MVQAGRVAESDGVRRGKQAKRGVRLDNPALIEQRQPAFDLEHPLDDEHHVGASGVVLVEDERAGPLQRPRQHAGLKLGDLFAVADDDGVLADQIHPADVAVEIHAHARPVEPRGDLFDVARLAGAVAALHHHAAVVHEPGEQRQRGVAIEHVVGVERRHVLVRPRKGRHLEVAVDLEQLARRPDDVRQVKGRGVHARRGIVSRPAVGSGTAAPTRPVAASLSPG